MKTLTVPRAVAQLRSNPGRQQTPCGVSMEPDQAAHGQKECFQGEFTSANMSLYQASVQRRSTRTCLSCPSTFSTESDLAPPVWRQLQLPRTSPDQQAVQPFFLFTGCGAVECCTCDLVSREEGECGNQERQTCCAQPGRRAIRAAPCVACRTTEIWHVLRANRLS